MNEYEVSFTRTESGFVTVTAADEAEAISKAYDAYHSGNANWGDEEISDMTAKKIRGSV